MEKFTIFTILIWLFLVLFDMVVPYLLLDFQRSVMKKKDESLNSTGGEDAVYFILLMAIGFILIQIYFFQILAKVNYRRNLFKEKFSKVFFYLLGCLVYFSNIYYLLITYFDYIKKVVVGYFIDLWKLIEWIF